MPERGLENREVGTPVDELFCLSDHRFEIKGDLNRVGCAVELLCNVTDLVAGVEQRFEFGSQLFIAITMSVIGAPIGIPLASLGFLLLIRALF